MESATTRVGAASDPGHAEEQMEHSTKTHDVEKQQSSSDLDNTEDKSSDTSTSDCDVVDYDGPDDPHNPYNWTPGKKWLHAGLLAYMSFVV